MSIQNITVCVDTVEAPLSIHKAFDDGAPGLTQIAPNGLPISRINIDCDGNKIAYEDIRDGYKYADGKYVILEKDEIKALNLDKSSRAEINCIVDPSEIHPSLFISTYYLGLDKNADEDYAVMQYSDLLAVIGESVAITEIVMRGRSYLAAIYKGEGRYLMMSTLHYAEQRRVPPFEVDKDPTGVQRLVGFAVATRMNKRFILNNYSNVYGKRLNDLIRNKVAAVTGTTTSTKKREKVQ